MYKFAGEALFFVIQEAGSGMIKGAKLLLVEDDYDLADNLLEFFEGKGCVMTHVPNGALALNELLVGAFDAVLLDVNLPGINGLELCARLRSEMKNSTPVLMLTAADTLDDKLRGFAAGTDDYVVKPFSLQEVEARLLSLLRRTDGGRVATREELTFGALELDLGQMRGLIAGEEVKLTTMGFRILQCLVENAPNIVKREDLERMLWGEEPPWSDALRSHVFALRKALAGSGGGVIELKTIRGVGYQLERH